MKSAVYLAASAFALTPAVPVSAQSMNMPGMTMPSPPKPVVNKKTKARRLSAKKPAAKKVVPKARTPVPSSPMPMPMPSQANPAPMPSQANPAPMPSQANPAPMPSQANPALMPPMPADTMTMPMATHAGHEMAMTGALGPYPMDRESSGTAWQPDTTEHTGLHLTSGTWTLMAHGVLNLIYDHQSGPRGNDKAFAGGMLMGMARRPLGNGTLQFKASVSPDPTMGASGYPLLLASGETANGVTPLVDRQHPHDFFMELSASVSQNVGPKSSVFLYAGLPAEPAFGPPAFMHREAILDSPEAPITHHWLDSTHISFGVVTAGLVVGRVKLEASRFNGREPDQRRWNIEVAPLDSTALRLSWNPTAEFALQGSWAYLKDPEQLEPSIDQKRLSASILYASEVAPGWKVAGTLAWGRKTAEGDKDDAFAAEGSVRHASWTLFARGELIDNRELLGLHGPAYRVGKVSLGGVRDFPIARHLSLGAGGLVALNFVPDALAPLYGGSNPIGAMGFVRLRLN